MLTALRRLAATWVAKLLFLLLILSFAVWGIGDMVNNLGRDTAIARVGGEPIELDQAQQAARRELQRLTRQLGGRFEADPAIRRAVAEQALEALILDRAIRQEAQRMHLATPDEAARGFVFSLPGFQGPDGRFSRLALENFLRGNELTEAQFLDLVRADLARQQLSNAVRAGATPPDALANPLFRWAQETRAAELVSLRTADAPEPPAPEEAQLRRFHENNPERFSTPEYREATVAVMTAERLTQEVEITEAELQAGYEARHAQFETPERRVLQQALLPEREKAEAIAAQWREGADFAAIAAAAAEAGGAGLDLGAMDRAGLPVPALAEAVFATPEGGVTAPVESPFGWHVLKVVRIEPGETRGLDQVRDQLRQELAAEKAADIAFERANRVEDALAGGATLAEAAQRFNLGLASVTTDAAGRGPDGQPVELPVIEAARPALLRVVFAAERGAAPRLTEGEAGFVAVELREVRPPALRPFETVEAELRRAFEEDAKRRAQEARAAALLAAVKGGRPLAEAAREAGLVSRQLGAIGRQPQQAGPVPPELLAPLFELPLNDATMVATREGFAVAQVLEISAPEPAADAAGMARLRQEVEQSIAQDLDVQFIAALRARADVRINPRLLDILAQP